jgi:hypothetical protein
MPPAGFEPTIPARKRPQTHALDRTATGIGDLHYKSNKNLKERRQSRVRDNVAGIATRYGLEGPGIESRWRRDFLHQFRPAVGTIQPPI